ncbi:MAG TPA: hypothetical protein VLZ81_03205, partial [Blastocatellia bacterium]|nr:hypothetical protein [Blastocatellia bacterium]
SLAQSQGSTSYWALETNTPFYGWGLTGRVETTALAVRAISGLANRRAGARGKSAASSANTSVSNGQAPAAVDESDRELVDRGLRFLLKNKDHFGVWYSTQATVSVLDTLMAELTGQTRRAGPPKDSIASGPSHDEAGQIYVNGHPAGTVLIKQGSSMENPITLDLSQYLTSGNNKVELRRPEGAEKASAQLVLSYYLPWTNADDEAERESTDVKHGLRLSVGFSKNEARIGEEISCSVKIERVGFSGYGMLVGEIGLPPGAEVDRDSLDKLLQHSDSIDRYEIQPDRLIVYAWPKAGGTAFEFKFRPRFAESAQTAPSSLYDYYNPEASVVRRPVGFVVR